MPKIPFESVAQADSYISYGTPTPALFIASNPSEAAHLIRWLNKANIAKQIQDIDFNTTWVVAVFREEVPSSGYGITIWEISTAPGTVHLTVNLTNRAADRLHSAIMSYPYHIVLIPREEIRVAPGTIWSVYATEGTLLVQSKYP